MQILHFFCNKWTHFQKKCITFAPDIDKGVPPIIGAEIIPSNLMQVMLP